MIIVPIDNLRVGMMLASDVNTTSAREYRTLFKKGTILKGDSIKLLRTQGIKTVKIVGFDEEEDIEEDLSDDEVKNQHIEYALSELNDIFESNEIRELSHEAVKKVDSIADDILSDLKNNSTYLGNQMIALQNYDDYTYKHCLRVSMLSTSICYESLQTPRITGSVKLLLMEQYARHYVRRVAAAVFKHIVADYGVALYFFKLLIGQLAGLYYYVVVDVGFADVVKQRGNYDLLGLLCGKPHFIAYAG